MAAVPPSQERSQQARTDETGKPVFEWTLTSTKLTDTVRLIAGPFNVLPVIFVPGIMGSNLKSKVDGKPVWRLDTGIGGIPWGMLSKFATKGPGPRQQLLHPDRCEVDDDGLVPKKGKHTKELYRARGWGEVGEGSYHKYLLWLENELNPAEGNPALWHDYYQAQTTISAPPQPGEKPRLFPGIRMGMAGEPFGAEKFPLEAIMSDDLMARARFMMPVYACGYNWLDSNEQAAKRLAAKIETVINLFNQGQYSCQQVLLVTHSMGGLVARACAQIPGMADRIAGIVHGVMPANGAAVAYRRCKIGMRDEDFGAGLVIGSTGQEVTAVFAQAPGALQLLPAHSYAHGWLKVVGDQGQKLIELPEAGKSSYDAIYRERKEWWGLVNEAWLSPKEGAPIDWSDYETNLEIAERFHRRLLGQYHHNSYVIYGADPKQPSFEKVTWRAQKGIAPDQRQPPDLNAIKNLPHGDIRGAGSTPGYVGGGLEVSPSFEYGMASTYQSSYWELHCERQDGDGDGTVPKSSGAAPLAEGGGSIRQQFKLSGFGHEPAYKNEGVQRTSLFAINKIAGTAKVPS
ncbi:MAG: alpha/beta hydrolase [Dechloromonas sp.]|nr:MAG: alpha/beta hydrolase [Dechloromonas sp.]